jgi:hypothetical protein
LANRVTLFAISNPGKCGPIFVALVMPFVTIEMEKRFRLGGVKPKGTPYGDFEDTSLRAVDT